MCFGFILGLNAEENTAQENMTEENTPKDAPILLEEKRSQTLEFEENKEAKKRLMKKACLKKSIRKNASFTCSKGNCMKKNESILFQQMAKNKSGFL